MATFDTIEVSNYLGTPILLYDFLRTSGGTDYHWRYCSSDKDVLYNSVVYKATAISDDGVKQDTEATNSELKITMPITDDFPQMFRGRGSTPSDSVLVTLRRLHVGTDPSTAPGVALWATGTNVSTSDGSVVALGPGASMAPGDSIDSPSAEFTLAFQTDQNVVLTQHGTSGDTVLWATATDGSGADTFIMQTDGNLVLYASGTPVWSTATNGNTDASLVLQNDGNLVVYSASSESDARVFWVGNVIGLSQQDEVKAEITCSMLLASFKRGGLRLSYTRGCPHALYDSQCKMNPLDFQVSDLLVSFTGNSLTMTDLSAYPNGHFNGGYLEWTMSSGLVERRGIRTHADNVLTISGSTIGMEAGMTIYMYPGCRRTRAVCNDKFSNILNYGGFADMPGKSPFSGDPVF